MLTVSKTKNVLSSKDKYLEIDLKIMTLVSGSIDMVTHQL
jgi:hypothetical protein